MNSQTRGIFGLAGVITLAMATELNQTVSGIALPDLMGGYGMSADPGRWFSAIYDAAQVVGLCVSPWFAITVTLRRMAMFVTVLALLSTLALACTNTLSLLFIFRALQGLAGGLTIPLLMTTALRVLPPPIRLYGLAAYATTATFFPYLSTTLAALWTDLVGWRFVFLQAIPTSTLALLLLWFGMPKEPPKYERFQQCDWRGILLISIGGTSLVTLLELGDWLDWFNSPLICVLALASGVALPLFVLNEWFHPLPLMKFQLLGRRNVAYGALALFVFVIVESASSSVPGAVLTSLAGYRPEQAYPVTLMIALIQLAMLPLLAVVLNWEWVDSRVMSVAGLVLILIACIGDSFVTVVWDRNEFYLWQTLQAVGSPMVVMPLLLMATNALMPTDGPFASPLVNGPRGIAEALGTWLSDITHRYRGSLHSSRLADQVGQHRFSTYQAHGVSWQHPAPLLPDGRPASPGSVLGFSVEFHKQVSALTLSDLFLILCVPVVFLIVLVLTLPQRTYPPRIVFAKR